MNTSSGPDGVSHETDVIVIGYGGAGAVAAIAATDAGASVTILEKRSFGGGATRLSSGGIMIPSGPGFADYLEDIWLGHTPRSVIARFVEEAMRSEEYCASIGISITGWNSSQEDVSVSYPGLGRPSWPNARHGDMRRPHAASAAEQAIPPDVWAGMTNNERVRHSGRPYGIDLWEQLTASVEKRDITINYDTQAHRLITDASGQVIGVLAECDATEAVYTARRAVILTTGGFASNEQMKQAHLSCPFIYAGTNDYATGDGHAMAQRVGARFWHMQTVCGQIGFKAPEFEQPFLVRAVSEAFVWVDKHGRRYTDETSEKLHNTWRNASLFDADHDLRDGTQWPRIPTYMVFDETMRQRAPLSRNWRLSGDYEWSLDNSTEIQCGWIHTGETIAALAKTLEMDADALATTITDFNEYCLGGTDPEYGRDPSTMKPILNGPFYAIPLVPVLISTQGGPEHDAESRVLDTDGRPVPRLYAAGELSSIAGWLYEAGSGHAECIVFGKIAGENAARELPYERPGVPTDVRMSWVAGG